MGSVQLRREDGEKVELPLESSPYVKYSGLEEYKMAGYGTAGHVEPVNMPRGRGGGGTDGPTLSGSGMSERQAKVMDAVSSMGMP
ncbi:hypothetical protein H6P81_016986 [Aristolochia fimbriata]|uniref:Uncharacterized protein n=1 Tax=Aristolochia fimbriata TaxID=158543 RepID=A0AAV7E182_ARIFI|nr:hypothetical protein H6P81_016986 [Aristolochia fimbriata]